MSPAVRRSSDPPEEAPPPRRSEESVRLTGSGWCANGRLLQGERSVRVRLVAVSGYASQEEIVVPVTFVDGAFDATVQLGGLYIRRLQLLEKHVNLFLSQALQPQG